MSDMKCPFCQQELRKIHPTYVICDNCRITGEDKLWQALIKTKQALDVAVMALKEFDKNNIDYGPAFEALHIIKQITESPAENVQSDTKSRPVNVQTKE